MRHQIAGESVIVQKAGVKGGNPHHGRGAGQGGQHLLQIKAGQEDHLAAGQKADVRGHEQPVGVKDRQGMQQHVLVGKGPEIGKHPGIGQQVVMAQHGAL